MSKQPNDKNNDLDKYQKKGFFRRLPFGLKATFIKYWFYGATYFFCFMGLGNVIKSSENLILATGLISGALFDIALYNIYILIADSREEASKWWIFKSKKFYSIFINIVVLTAIFFLFRAIIVPIKAAMPKKAVWLFQEPLSAALLLTLIDTSIVWIKNLAIKLFVNIFKNNNKQIDKKEAYIKIIDLTPVSVSFELNNKESYYINKPYNIVLNNEIIFKKITTNSFTIFDLKPDTQYKLTINQQTVTFITPRIYKAYKLYEGHDIQKVIDMADQYSLIIVNKGTYNIKSLNLKNNIVLYIRKGANLIASINENDYQILPPFFGNKNEVYGNYKGEAKQMRYPIINIDHLENVKIVGEGTIDGQGQLITNHDDLVAPSNLIFINRSKDISIIGLRLKNSPQTSIHSFFSSSINLINLNITSEKKTSNDGIHLDCSNNINVVGSYFSSLNDSVSVKSCKNDIARIYQTPSKNISIRNCYVEHSASGISFGEESSSGIYNVNLSQSLFKNVNYGVIVKTKRGSGKEAIVKDINVNNIKMDEIDIPIVMNMYYENKALDGIEDGTYKKFVPVDENTPYLGNFVFENIEVKNFKIASSYFIGLIEKYIYEIKIINSSFIGKMDSELSPKGFVLKNVRTLNLKHVKLENVSSKRVDIENVSEIIDQP